jgi:hypothetical protein
MSMGFLFPPWFLILLAVSGFLLFWWMDARDRR